MKKLLKWLILLTVIAGLVYWFGFRTKAEEPKEDDDHDMLYSVVKKDLVVGIIGPGTINARENYKLSLQASVSTKVTKLVDENTEVKKGDILVEFDKDDLENKVEDYKLEYENSLKELDIAKEELEILKSSNEADIRQAVDSVSDAEEAFHKYIKLEGPKAKDDQQLSVDNAIKALNDAKQAIADKEIEHSNTVYDTQEDEERALAEIEQLEKTYEQKQLSYDNTSLARKMFKRYDYPNRISSLENSLAQKKLNLEKTKVRVRSNIIQKENSLIRVRNNIQRHKKNYETYLGYLDKMKIVAPVDGVVIYGDPTSRWDKTEVKVGMDCHRGTVLMTIPDMNSLIVKFSIPEQFRSRVALNDPVIITPDSLPNLRIEGLISKIDMLPVHQISWDRNSPKVYRARVEFKNEDSRLLSGMSAQVEVITKTLKNVLSVPIEAVFEEKGQFFVYLKHGRKAEIQPVTIGTSNDDSVQIIRGLKENDVIYLYNPFFTEE